MPELRAVQSSETPLGPCSKCYPNPIVPGTIATLYGPYCADCYERNRESITDATRALQKHRVEYFRRLSEMGERFQERTFENYRVNDANREAFEAAKTALEDDTGLYLFGRPGNGKSHLAGSIVNAATQAGTEAIFVTGVGLLQRIRETYRRREGESERGILEHYASVKILVIDDLGTENFTPDTGRLFYALINRRYELRSRSLIVTSNLSPADLALQWNKSGVEQHVSHKIIDRIRELCSNRFVRLDAPSERGQTRKD